MWYTKKQLAMIQFYHHKLHCIFNSISKRTTKPPKWNIFVVNSSISKSVEINVCIFLYMRNSLNRYDQFQNFIFLIFGRWCILKYKEPKYALSEFYEIFKKILHFTFLRKKVKFSEFLYKKELCFVAMIKWISIFWLQHQIWLLLAKHRPMFRGWGKRMKWTRTQILKFIRQNVINWMHTNWCSYRMSALVLLVWICYLQTNAAEGKRRGKNQKYIIRNIADWILRQSM